MMTFYPLFLTPPISSPLTLFSVVPFLAAILVLQTPTTAVIIVTGVFLRFLWNTTWGSTTGLSLILSKPRLFQPLWNVIHPPPHIRLLVRLICFPWILFLFLAYPPVPHYASPYFSLLIAFCTEAAFYFAQDTTFIRVHSPLHEA